MNESELARSEGQEVIVEVEWKGSATFMLRSTQLRADKDRIGECETSLRFTITSCSD